MSSAMEVNRNIPAQLTEPDDSTMNQADKLMAWNRTMINLSDRKWTQERLSGKKIKMALCIHELKDPQSRTVEFIRSSTANRFVNMVTISPPEGAEGPKEEFIWNAADTAASSTEFSEPRITRLGKAMELLDNSLRGTDTNGEA
jgi:hypothetical protein